MASTHHSAARASDTSSRPRPAADGGSAGEASAAPVVVPEARAPVPRVLTWAVVKRIDPRLWDTWGHWWIEFGEESYGWWPTPCPMGWRGAMLGTSGVLNGIGMSNGGTPTRDAYHGEEPDHQFHPAVIVDKSDDQIRADIRAFAHSYVGGFRWQWWWLRQGAENCRTFQDEMFQAAGLFEDREYLYTRGSGCPFMFPLRRAKWEIIDGLGGAMARTRSRLHLGRGASKDVAGTVGREFQPDADSLALTDPKARARARIKGTLLPDRADADA